MTVAVRVQSNSRGSIRLSKVCTYRAVFQLVNIREFERIVWVSDEFSFNFSRSHWVAMKINL